MLEVEVRNVDVYCTLATQNGKNHFEDYFLPGTTDQLDSPVVQLYGYIGGSNWGFTKPTYLPNVVGGDLDRCIHPKCCEHRDFKCWRLAFGEAGYCGQCKHTVSYTLKSRVAHGTNIIRNFFGDTNDKLSYSSSDSSSSSSSDLDSSDSSSDSSSSSSLDSDDEGGFREFHTHRGTNIVGNTTFSFP
eukprot:CAMPEP_0197287920 /NCGR_PEP_ID=MMETSP0890-20130614/4781_1 /TAXON_ID=44058 ORGANISM="Aureoumbra lagunensis, Strain CCMP1510" /NCGR_SAMPLE_ID=MMETSP0890 /ASSEMBLY_ACC=CAM_ASM_000533 /LENGTH=186 /DNA_ID=CAMNT_0042758181 /DNA_START=592 /DNA_END=1152 /DNA_ORIENTATION=+